MTQTTLSVDDTRGIIAALFRRFKDVLLSYPVERDRWFQYRANLLHIYIDSWLGAQDVTIGEPPARAECRIA